MIDGHSHVLPSMDDGSRNVRESIAMLRTLKEQGIHTVIATSHFYAKHNTPAEFLKRRRAAADTLREEIQVRGVERELPRILLGAEVAYYSGISRSEEVRHLVIEGTDLLLLELPYTPWNMSMIEEVGEVQRNLGVRVILAHLERYYAIRKNRVYIRYLLEQNLLIQVNISSFYSRPTKRFLWKLLQEEGIDFLGSDCHNMRERKPKWDEFYEYFQKKDGMYLVEVIQRKMKNRIDKEMIF